MADDPTKEPPGMNSGVAVDLTGGAATGGETSVKMGDWSGSDINMGGGGNDYTALAAALSFLGVLVVGLFAWLARK